MVYVVAVITGIAVVLHNEPGFPLLQQESNTLILILRLAEATELKNPPGLGAISAGVGSTVERRHAGISSHTLPLLLRDVAFTVKFLQREARR